MKSSDVALDVVEAVEALPRAPVSRSSACRSCDAPLVYSFVDLCMTPLCQRQIPENKLNEAEVFYPLHAFVCHECFLVQVEEYVSPDEIFDDSYPYFSSCSASWVDHAATYAEHMVSDFHIGKNSFVVEIASNDGYLLQNFVRRGVPCLGVEPAAAVAAVAEEKGIDTERVFFGLDTAKRILVQRQAADLIVGNNVLAHTPSLHDFVAGVKCLLADDGVFTFEFPHLLTLLDNGEFDTIYHEHFCYFSLHAVTRVLASHGLEIFDVKELSTHGGSLRIYGQHQQGDRTESVSVQALANKEQAAGLFNLEIYRGFQGRVDSIKNELLTFLIEQRKAGKKVVGYGAPGKGNTLLNYCGIRRDLLAYTVDAAESKQGTYTPGTHIPIYEPEQIARTRPDYILILPWNLSDEIVGALDYARSWGAKFVVAIPELRIF